MLKRKLPLLYLGNKYAKCFINTLLVEKEIQNIFVRPFWICLNNIFIVKEGRCLFFRCGKYGEWTEIS